MMLIGRFRSVSCLVFLIVFNLATIAGQPPMPPGEHGSDDNKKPASIHKGMIIVTVLGFTYGMLKKNKVKMRRC